MEFAKNIQTSEKEFSFASLYNGNIYLQIGHGCCVLKCQKNYFTKKLLHKLIRSNYRTSLEQEDIILEGHQTRGGPAMMLAEINDDEDNDINRETWYQVKRGMEDRKLTSGPSQAFNQPCLLLHGHREPQGQMQGVDAGSTDSSI